MNTFDHLDLNRQLRNVIEDLGFEKPTPIQEQAFSIIRSGKDVVGISQTGTGKTFAYAMPILRDLKFSKQTAPRVIILVPTRELVVQVVEQFESYAKYFSLRIKGIYGGTNLNTQGAYVAEGCDILVATPGRLYDSVLARYVQLKSVNKLVIDEVDVMLDLGFSYQLNNIFELLPERRQNIMFSATMTDEVNDLIIRNFHEPDKISIAVSGTPLNNISQTAYPVKNFKTKVNLLSYLIKDKSLFTKVLVFVSTRKAADRLFELMEEEFGSELCIIHSNKSQNYRLRSVQELEEGKRRVLIATDVIARGLDLSLLSHVINFDTPNFPENYMHRIGRTGRAEQEGKTILFYTEKEQDYKEAIETLMNQAIPELPFPEEVDESNELVPEERPRMKEINTRPKKDLLATGGGAFHEKKAKNKKTNQGGSYRRKLAEKYSKPKTRGDKKQNKRKRK